MSLIRDPSVSKYFIVSSALDNVVGELNNFSVPTSQTNLFQRTKAIQLQNVSFTPRYSNVLHGGNYIEWSEQNRWSIWTQSGQPHWRLVLLYRGGVDTSEDDFGAVYRPTIYDEADPNSDQAAYASMMQTEIQAILDANLPGSGMTFLLRPTHWSAPQHIFWGTFTDPVRGGTLYIIPEDPSYVESQGFLGSNGDMETHRPYDVVEWGKYGWVFLSGLEMQTPTIQSGYANRTDKMAVYRKTIPSGTYSRDEILALLTSAPTEEVSHPGGDWPAAVVSFDVDPSSGRHTRVLSAGPGVVPYAHKASIRLMRSDLALALGFRTFFGEEEYQVWAPTQVATAEPTLEGPLRFLIHVKPSNSGQCVMPREQPLRTAAWGSVPAIGSGVKHFYDFTHASDGAYIQGFQEPINCAQLDISIRTIDGAPVELTLNGLEVQFKIIYEP